MYSSTSVGARSKGGAPQARASYFALSKNPRPPGQLVKAIHGSKDAFLRMRIGNYRLTYEIDDPNKIVLILEIIHRKDLEEWLRGAALIYWSR